MIPAHSTHVKDIPQSRAQLRQLTKICLVAHFSMANTTLAPIITGGFLSWCSQIVTHLTGVVHKSWQKQLQSKCCTNWYQQQADGGSTEKASFKTFLLQPRWLGSDAHSLRFGSFPFLKNWCEPCQQNPICWGMPCTSWSSLALQSFWEPLAVHPEPLPREKKHSKKQDSSFIFTHALLIHVAGLVTQVPVSVHLQKCPGMEAGKGRRTGQCFPRTLHELLKLQLGNYLVKCKLPLIASKAFYSINLPNCFWICYN